MKIAQRFSAGWEPGTINKSVKRTAERYRSAGFRFSRPLRGLYESLCPRIPPMNRWAIVIRRLRRLLQQSSLAQEYRVAMIHKEKIKELLSLPVDERRRLLRLLQESLPVEAERQSQSNGDQPSPAAKWLLS